jgi:hypothetical protein
MMKLKKTIILLIFLSKINDNKKTEIKFDR